MQHRRQVYTESGTEAGCCSVVQCREEVSSRQTRKREEESRNDETTDDGCASVCARDERQEQERFSDCPDSLFFSFALSVWRTCFSYCSFVFSSPPPPSSSFFHVPERERCLRAIVLMLMLPRHRERVRAKEGEGEQVKRQKAFACLLLLLVPSIVVVFFFFFFASFSHSLRIMMLMMMMAARRREGEEQRCRSCCCFSLTFVGSCCSRFLLQVI